MDNKNTWEEHIVYSVQYQAGELIGTICWIVLSYSVLISIIEINIVSIMIQY